VIENTFGRKLSQLYDDVGENTEGSNQAVSLEREGFAEMTDFEEDDEHRLYGSSAGGDDDVNSFSSVNYFKLANFGSSVSQ